MQMAVLVQTFISLADAFILGCLYIFYIFIRHTHSCIVLSHEARQMSHDFIEECLYFLTAFNVHNSTAN